jgi:hypothetical protein
MGWTGLNLASIYTACKDKVLDPKGTLCLSVGEWYTGNKSLIVARVIRN